MAERLTRDQTRFYLQESVAKLSQHAAIALTKDPALKTFLLFLVEQEPRRMSGILKTALDKASAAVSAIDAHKAKEKTAEKRAAPSGVDIHETCKRAKLADTLSGKAANISVRASLSLIIEDADVTFSAELWQPISNDRSSFGRASPVLVRRGLQLGFRN